MLEIKERDPFSSLVLEVLDDPTKKEMVFYLMCYSQLVRRDGSFHIELERFLSCAYRNFRNARNYWKDILVEMNLFVISDLYGNLYKGKDIYRVEEGGVYLISLKHEYAHLFDELSYKALKLWNVLSRMVVYRRFLTAQDAVVVSTLMFNEGLYEEVKGYSEVCAERYLAEAIYFKAIGKLSSLYMGDLKKTPQNVRAILGELEKLKEVYYGINMLKLRRDLENLAEKVERSKAISPIKIEFVNQKMKGGGWLKSLLKRLMDIFGKVWGGWKDRDSYCLEETLCSRSFRTPYTN
ncbi:MAG: hypothetical protein N3D14_05045 [Aquificaceae bacterium]|nr:hypothetical protein [Aquificaceae bacterium]